MCKCSKGVRVGTGIFFLLICITLVFLTIYGPHLLDNYLTEQILKQRVVDSPSAEGYDQWQRNYGPNSPPAFLYLYVYNLTNPTEVLEGAKPILDQRGPYAYKWRWEKFDINFSKNGDQVQFFKAEYFIFDANQTNNTALNPYKDFCFFPSVPYFSVRSTLGLQDDWWRAVAFDLVSSAAGTSVEINENSPFINITVHDYIWGYNSSLLSWVGNTLGPLVGLDVNPFFQIQNNDTSEEACRARKVNPDTMYTGKSNGSLLNQFMKWQGYSHLRVDGHNIWATDNANTVTGTDALGFTVNIQSGANQTVFVEETYRHVNFISNETQKLQDITTNLYFLDPREFRSVQDGFPDYYLFAPHGASNISSPNTYFRGAPVEILLSQPHFFQADPSYSSAFEILPPNNITKIEEHNTFIWVEPITGITMKAFKRLQVNLKVQGSFFFYPKLNLTFLPIAYFEETSELTPALANQWKSTVGLALEIKEILPIVGYSLAGFVLLVSGSFFVLAWNAEQAPSRIN